MLNRLQAVFASLHCHNVKYEVRLLELGSEGSP
jgi:hypothetical protein